MADMSSENVLARLAGHSSAGPDPWPGLAAVEPRHEAPPKGPVKSTADLPTSLVGLNDEQLEALLGGSTTASVGDAVAPPAAESKQPTEFIPPEPRSFAAANLTVSEVEALILKLLLAMSAAGKPPSNCACRFSCWMSCCGN